MWLVCWIHMKHQGLFFLKIKKYTYIWELSPATILHSAVRVNVEYKRLCCCFFSLWITVFAIYIYVLQDAFVQKNIDNTVKPV